MTGDPTRDAEATEHNFIGGEDNDYVTAKQAQAEKAKAEPVVTRREWCVHIGADPDVSPLLFIYDDIAEAEENLQWIKGSRIAWRDVTYGPWQTEVADG